MIVLFLVVYSCITSTYYISFSDTNNPILINFDIFAQCAFWLDIILNFIQSFKHPETFEEITDLKQIAHNYIFKGWFIVDFLSTFPFSMLSQNGGATKLLRLFRLPRLIKLIDISRFNKLLKSFMSDNQAGDEKIETQYMLLYVYKILRLIIIAIIITYFVGCFWWLFCSNYT